ncbi:MAG: hypothetical protein HQM09_10060 [Candidatus Riflebacteria bacterium]|nr:hypothetical protein [Candidatus Riflebacteria bacterium]
MTVLNFIFYAGFFRRDPLFKGGTQIGVTLLEIIIAMLIMAMAVLPLIRSFSQSHALAVKQLNQEIALKVAEATLNAAMSAEYAYLDGEPTAIATGIPLYFEMPNQAPITTSIVLTGPGLGSTTGVASFQVGPTFFQVTLDCVPLFGTSPFTTPLVLSFADWQPSYAHPLVATYSCPADERVLRISSTVSWESNKLPQNITLESCRVKLSK